MHYERSPLVHAICVSCWTRTQRRPLSHVRMQPRDDWEACCFCGGQAQHGIFLRADPLDAPNCRGHRQRA
jgi:hypothetical protein